MWKEEEDKGEEKNNKLDRGRMRRTREARACLPRLPCSSLVLNFDRLCLLLESVSLLSFGQGRRDDTPSLGKGAGVRGSEGCQGGERGLELTGGYKYPLEPDDHTVLTLRNWWKRSGGTLGCSRPLETPSTSKPFHPPSPPSLSLSFSLSSRMMVGTV